MTNSPSHSIHTQSDPNIQSNPKGTPKEIIVIGAGILGGAIGFRLAQRGATVTLIDAGEPGRATTAVSFAWINSRGKQPRHYHDLNRRSLDMWDRFARQVGAPDALTWGGELRWAATPQGAEEMLDAVEGMQGWGYPIRALAPESLPQLEPNLVSGPAFAASHTPIDGHVDAVRIAQACAQQVHSLGGQLLTNTRVVALQIGEKGEGVTVVTEQGSRRADRVVIAGGPATAAIAALAGIDIPMYDTFGCNVLTEPTEPFLHTAAVVHCPRDAAMRVHVRQLPDGRVAIQGGIHGEHWDESLGQTDEEVAKMVAAVRAYFPSLAHVPIAEVRRGRRPIPKDGLPIIGFAPEHPNIYIATMHSGVTLSAAVSELAALEIVNDASVDLLEPYRLERFDGMTG